MITHYKKFSDSKRLLSDFYLTIEKGLQNKLGSVLFQLPPRQSYSEAKLQQIAESLLPNFINVVEFRHQSWWNEQVYTELVKYKISFCSMSHPELPDNVISNTPILYYRFHGVPELYKSKYDKSVLQRVSNEIANSGKVRQAYIYFNNDIGASAIENVKQFEIITGRNK